MLASKFALGLFSSENLLAGAVKRLIGAGGRGLTSQLLYQEVFTVMQNLVTKVSCKLCIMSFFFPLPKG